MNLVNFTYREFKCECSDDCRAAGMPDYVFRNILMLGAILQLLRKAIDKPFNLTSGYRCREHNKTVGGAEKSTHLLGMAADVSTAFWNTAHKVQLTKLLKQLNVYHIWYDSHIHIDTRNQIK